MNNLKDNNQLEIERNKIINLLKEQNPELFEKLTTNRGNDDNLFEVKVVFSGTGDNNGK